MKRLIEGIRNWRAFRYERRRSLEQARRFVLLLSVGGTIQGPRRTV